MSFDPAALTQQAIITSDKIGVGGFSKSKMGSIRRAKSLRVQIFGAFAYFCQIEWMILAQLSQNQTQMFTFRKRRDRINLYCMHRRNNHLEFTGFDMTKNKLDSFSF